MRAQGPLFVDMDISVSFHDVDMVGVVWHGHYLRYIEDARWALMDRVGYGLNRMVESGFSWPIVEVHTKYLSSARFGDRLRVRASLIEWTSRLTLNYLLTRPADGTRIARAKTVQLAVDVSTGALQFELPADLITAVGIAIDGDIALRNV